MVVLPLSTTTTNTITALDYVEIIHAVKMTEKTVILTHGFHNWPNPNLSSKNTVNIDIWPFPSPSSSSNSDNEGLYCSFAMIIQIGHVLSLARLWRHLDVRLRVWYLVDWEHQISAERKRVEAFLRDLRVEAECRVLSLERCNPTWFDRAMRNAFSSENHSADSASTSFSAAKVTGRSEFSGPGAGETMDYGGIAQFGSPLVFARCSLRERYALLQELFLRFSDQADLLLTSLIPPDAEVRSGEMFAQSYLKTLLSACSVGPPICLIHASTVAVTTEL